MFSALTLLMAFLPAAALGVPLQNMTVSSPPGAMNHGNPKLLCLPTTWYRVIIFLLTNYIAHAATINKFSGEKSGPYLFATFVSLMYPYVGLIRGISPIFRHAAFDKHPLKKAALAGALCIVVRNPQWTPVAGEQVVMNVHINSCPQAKITSAQGDSGGEELRMLAHPADSAGSRKSAILRVDDGGPAHFFVEETVSSLDAKVHGIRTIPTGYVLRVLPSNAVVVPNTELDPAEIEITSSSNLAKSFIALIQLISGATTLYRTRGDETTRFGYAAFGLTVIPYMVMSLANLTGSFLTPTYESLYLVNSPELEEARSREGAFDGTVGKIVPLDHAGGRTSQTAVFKSDNFGTTARIMKSSSGADLNHSEVHRTPNSERIDLEIQTAGFTEEQVFEILRDGKEGASEIVVPRYTPFKTSGPSHWGRKQLLHLVWIGWLFQTIPYAVIGGLTRFHPGESTRSQRIWSMLWLTFGVFFGWIFTTTFSFQHDNTWRYLVLLLFAAPAVGGYVVVCQMLVAYGYCIDIGEAI